MNQFKHLDTLFPCVPNRYSGEVVSVSVSLLFFGDRMPVSVFADESVPVISWKRKAWYVNASVNAFHMHRALCGEFRDCLNLTNMNIPDRHVRAVKRLLASVVMNSYLCNYRDGSQYHSYKITIDSSLDRSPAAWWIVGNNELDVREICVGHTSIPVVKNLTRHVDVEKIDYQAWSDHLREFDAVKLRNILDGIQVD